MKKANTSKIRNALKGKGMYIAIASCAVIIGGAGIIAYNQAIKDIETDITYIPPKTGKNTTVTTANAPDKDVEDISIEIGEQLSTLVTTQPKFMPIGGEAVILNPFSDGELVKSETLGIWKTHDGVDIEAELGEVVKSMTSGTVSEVKNDAMWGTCVVIEHPNGVVGYYCNLSTSVNVKAGDTVDAGDTIGTVGNTAEAEISMKPHLHFGLKQNGKWIDPIEYINPTRK